MKEIKEIIQSFDRETAIGKKTALATVVHVDGSAYRRPGARMLITEDGMLTGAISGGCLEGDALRKALLAITGNRSMIVTYDTNDEDDAKFGLGLGCNGVIRVLFEPVNPMIPDNPVELLRTAISKRQHVVVGTIWSQDDSRSDQPGTTYLLNESATISKVPDPVAAALEKDATEILITRQPAFKKYTGRDFNYTAFIEVIEPPISLVIAGAGNDVQPLVEMAVLLGWETTIIDGRRNYAAPGRFHPSCSVVVARPGEALEKIVIDNRTVFALLTHNYQYDLALLKELFHRNARYIGLLGPVKKKNRMLDEIASGGFVITEQHLASLHGPIGLAIGATTPAEIALSILAEIQSVLFGTSSISLKETDQPIHDRSGSSFDHVRVE